MPISRIEKAIYLGLGLGVAAVVGVGVLNHVRSRDPSHVLSKVKESLGAEGVGISFADINTQYALSPDARYFAGTVKVESPNPAITSLVVDLRAKRVLFRLDTLRVQSILFSPKLDYVAFVPASEYAEAVFPLIIDLRKGNALVVLNKDRYDLSARSVVEGDVVRVAARTTTVVTNDNIAINIPNIIIPNGKFISEIGMHWTRPTELTKIHPIGMVSGRPLVSKFRFVADKSTLTFPYSYNGQDRVAEILMVRMTGAELHKRVRDLVREERAKGEANDTILLAAYPFAGTWKAEPSSIQQALSQFTVESGKQGEVSQVQGTELSVSDKVQNLYQGLTNARAMIRPIGDLEYEVTVSFGTEPTETHQATLSQDGRTLTLDTAGTDDVHVIGRMDDSGNILLDIEIRYSSATSPLRVTGVVLQRISDAQPIHLESPGERPEVSGTGVWNGRIKKVYSERENGNGNTEIYAMDTDGNIRRLTRNPGRDENPSLSPDKSMIASNSDRDSGPAIYVMDIEGGNVRKVHELRSLSEPIKWAKDGKRLIIWEVPGWRGYDVKLGRRIYQVHRRYVEINTGKLSSHLAETYWEGTDELLEIKDVDSGRVIWNWKK